MKFRNRVISLISISVLVLITFKLFGSKRDKNNVQPLEVRDHSDKKEENITELVNKYSINFDSEIKDWPWNVAAGWVKPREVHPQDTPEMGAILNAMATAPIISADVGYKGTQLKLLLLLKGGQRVAFKPKWYRRETVVKGSPYSGRDRHNGEIAAFHLNRILEFRRAPLVVGRRVDLKTDIMPVATEKLLSTFFEKDCEGFLAQTPRTCHWLINFTRDVRLEVEHENTCFYGKCLYCRGPEDGVCAEGTRLEGIVILWLPSRWRLQPFRHPWSRTYRTNKLARWETEEDYCESVQQMALYQSGPRLLDILDSAVFDYLIGNADRHHYEAFKDDPEAMLILMDSAKSFGNPYIDERTILAPVYQCCRLRRQTWDRLLVLRDGVLSQVLQRILKNEPIAPILTKPHFEAIDRRLTHVFKEMQNCFDSHGKRNVLIDE